MTFTPEQREAALSSFAEAVYQTGTPGRACLDAALSAIEALPDPGCKGCAEDGNQMLGTHFGVPCDVCIRSKYHRDHYTPAGISATNPLEGKEPQ